MSALDWIVLVGTIGFIAVYGAWKTRRARDLDDYFRAGNTLAWPTIGLGIMATQASAITFLSTPGQAYEDGMRFVQFYLGLPLAMIVICAVFVPIYYRLGVYTAYEYLERRFDVRVRYLGAALFLVQRGLAAGITIYAPAIILSAILGWPLGATNLAIGLVVIAYTVSGGTAAVGQTQKQQMVVMLAGVAVAAAVVVLRLPDGVSLPAAVKLAGALDRMNVVRFELDPSSRYTFWSGITGGFFLALAYFGTDQSQVQRYLSGRSVAESRLGLLFNGMLKIPMQFVILFTGVLVFVFHLFIPPPIFFHEGTLARVAAGEHADALRVLEARYEETLAVQRAAATAYVAALDGADQSQHAHAKADLRAAAATVAAVRAETKDLIARAAPDAETKDADYVFLSFVLAYVPPGLVGLLVAVILCAAMSSTAAELAALGATTTIDFYKRALGGGADGGADRRAADRDQPGATGRSDGTADRDRASRSGASRVTDAGAVERGSASARRDLLVSKVFTVFWGLVAVSFATFASLLDNLIEAVNILGSIFYGTVLGLFVVGFFVAFVSATPVLVAALVAQALVLGLFLGSDLGFLWYNVIGCATVVGVSVLLEAGRRRAGSPSRVS